MKYLHIVTEAPYGKEFKSFITTWQVAKKFVPSQIAARDRIL